jgi:uncharacterized protein YndB with AHSA1/START domain
MASIRKELVLERPAQAVWEAFRDVGAVHWRLAPGFVTDCRMEGADRIVTFANGWTVREAIVDVDDAQKRLAYSAKSERLAHHHAAFQVLEAGPGRCRVVWIADVLPHEAARSIGPMMEQGAAAMKRALEALAESA